MASKDGSKPGGGSGGRVPILPLPLPSNIARLPSADRREKLRILEALLFAAAEPLDEASLAKHLGAKDDVRQLLDELQSLYSGRGVNLVRVAGKWAFRTAEDLSFLLGALFGRAKEALQGRARNSGNHRLSPARHARRDRGNPGRQHLEGLARRAAGNRLGAFARPQARAGQARHLRDVRRRSSNISASIPFATCPALPSLRAPGFSTATCRPASACPSRTIAWCCARTRSRSRTRPPGSMRRRKTSRSRRKSRKTDEETGTPVRAASAG